MFSTRNIGLAQLIQCPTHILLQICFLAYEDPGCSHLPEVLDEHYPSHVLFLCTGGPSCRRSRCCACLHTHHQRPTTTHACAADSEWWRRRHRQRHDCSQLGTVKGGCKQVTGRALFLFQRKAATAAAAAVVYPL
eukprot:1140732-Pelagomonas_calceolata.AAC.5